MLRVFERMQMIVVLGKTELTISVYSRPRRANAGQHDSSTAKVAMRSGGTQAKHEDPYPRT